MSKNINVRIALKRDTSANWTKHNPVLLNGELILVDTAEGQLRVKIGDGIKTYTQLPFMDEALRALITEVDNNNSKVVLKDLINNAEDEVLGILNIVRLSQQQYNSLEAAGTLDPKAIYMTEAANGGNTDELKTYIDNADATTLNSAKTYSNNNFLKLSGGTVTGVTTFSNTTASTSTTTGAVKISGGLGVAGNIYANKVYGAVWNDYAECRESNEFIDAGRVVKENGDDTLSIADGRLIYGCSIVSDTFGFMIGETDKAHTPIAVSGRVLAYPYENREVFRSNIGCFVCSGPNGTVSLMDKEEVWNHPEAIIGQVSAVPDYEYWGNNVKVNGRVWIKVR